MVVFSHVPSPTASWTAIGTEYTCDLGLLPSTAITAEVHLVSKERPTDEVDVLGVDTHGDVEDRPRMAWTAPKTLRVTVPNLADLTVLTRRVGDISIDLRFDPDDPAARAAWLKQWKSETDPLERP